MVCGPSPGQDAGGEQPDAERQRIHYLPLDAYPYPQCVPLSNEGSANNLVGSRHLFKGRPDETFAP